MNPFKPLIITGAVVATTSVVSLAVYCRVLAALTTRAQLAIAAGEPNQAERDAAPLRKTGQSRKLWPVFFFIDF
jgi:hypothetical protein